jgi:1,2-phenylacetyl-CoA epoxidase catalytic subunit
MRGMEDYRVHFLDGGDEIVLVEEITAASDDEAARLARHMFAERPHHRGFELWQLGRQLLKEAR